MKIQKFNFENTEFIQIYLTKEENENEEIIKKIEKMKVQNPNVAIFVTGTNNTTNVLSEIINYEKNIFRKD